MDSISGIGISRYFCFCCFGPSIVLYWFWGGSIANIFSYRYFWFTGTKSSCFLVFLFVYTFWFSFSASFFCTFVLRYRHDRFASAFSIGLWREPSNSFVVGFFYCFFSKSPYSAFSYLASRSTRWSTYSRECFSSSNSS